MKQLMTISFHCNCNTSCLHLFVTFLQLEKYCTLQFSHIQNLDDTRRVWYENYKLILDVCIFTITWQEPFLVILVLFTNWPWPRTKELQQESDKWVQGCGDFVYKIGTFPINCFFSIFVMNYNYCQQNEGTSDTQWQTWHKVQE